MQLAKSCMFFYLYYKKLQYKQVLFFKYVYICSLKVINIQFMKVKNSRLDAIRLILSTQEIGSQEELLSVLAQEGFKLTQATLSRDLHQLRVVKTVGLQGRYRYVLTRPHQQRHESKSDDVRPVTTPQEASGFMSIKFSGNMAVIRTKPS